MSSFTDSRAVPDDPLSVAPTTPDGGEESAVAEVVLEVIDASHQFGDLVALENVTIKARAGEFLTLLGESGSGKTTLLRIIAGLEAPTHVERISIAGEIVTNIPASERNTTTVFQHYALFPHMSVGENIEYGLRVRGIAREERRRRAMEALELVRLPHKYDRGVHQLSGGERQRVALARALVTRPTILLLDEPLGALDEKLRLEMQVELLELHRQLGMTFIYVTHSQEEALTMSDRILLMHRGRVVQEGTPHALFERPINRFVADFMGFENLLEGTLVTVDGALATTRLGDCLINGMWCGDSAPTTGMRVAVAVRAESVRLGADGQIASDQSNRIDCRASSTIYKGKYLDRTLECEFGLLKARIWDKANEPSRPAYAWWRAEDCAITTLA